MRPIFPFIHVLLAGIWVGCILTEALFERAMSMGDRKSHLALAELHARVDNFIEIPAFTGVFFTGSMMYAGSTIGGVWFHVKVAAGLAAILINIYCVLLVYKRRSAARTGNWASFDALDHKQHKFGALVLVFVLLAALIGMVLRSAV